MNNHQSALKFKPTACFEYLQKRAQLLKQIRRFFDERQVLEVETPILSHSTVTSPYIASLSTYISLAKPTLFYMQTSPEFAMKRLLAAGYGDVYQITKAFRDGEQGQRHNPEFTLLEWYRTGFDHIQLMNEMDLFLQTVIEAKPALRYRYQDLFQQFLNIDPFSSSSNDLKDMIKNKNIDMTDFIDDRDTLLDILMTQCIEPFLGLELKPVFVYDFPASQAALARIRSGNPSVAERFEVYLNGMELANGFHELSDGKEQRKRFEAENQLRMEKDLPLIPLDENFLAALEYGLPDCAGVALGIDRLLMAVLNTSNIEDVITFPVEYA